MPSEEPDAKPALVLSEETVFVKKTCASLLLTVGVVGAGWAVGDAMAGAVPEPQPSCTSETYEWSGDQLLVPWNPTFQAGEIPGPAVGESLVVSGVQYASWDEYDEGTIPSRADADQPNESFGITIGGIDVGGLSADLPDTLEEGAPTIWYSGIQTGSLGGSGTVIDGGIIEVRHVSLYGFGSEPANSVHAAGLTVDVDRCVEPLQETTTTVAEPTTTAGPTTTVESATPTAAPTTTRATGPNTTVRVASAATLPATGRGSGTLLLVASICGSIGAALLIVRRRPAAAVD